MDKKALTDEWTASGDLFAAVLAGLLLGLGLDAWLNTSPWLVIAGVLLGVYTGVRRMWIHSKKIDEQAAEALRWRRGL